jgi:hypothetical protein
MPGLLYTIQNTQVNMTNAVCTFVFLSNSAYNNAFAYSATASNLVFNNINVSTNASTVSTTTIFAALIAYGTQCIVTLNQSLITSQAYNLAFIGQLTNSNVFVNMSFCLGLTDMSGFVYNPINTNVTFWNNTYSNAANVTCIGTALNNQIVVFSNWSYNSYFSFWQHVCVNYQLSNLTSYINVYNSVNTMVSVGSFNYSTSITNAILTG